MFEKFDLIIRNTFTKTLPRAILIGIVCSIAIWIIIDTYFRNRAIPPLGLIYSNVSSTSATVNFLTDTPLATCATLFSFWPLSFQRSCDLSPSKLHNLRIEKLVPNVSYHLFIESGFRIWLSGYESLDKTQKINKFFSVTTRPKDYQLDQDRLLTITGNIVDAKEEAEKSALVILGETGSSQYWSGTANSLGNFSVTTPEISLLSEIALNVWSEDGHFAQVFPAIDLVKDTKKIIVQDYE